MKNRNEIPLLSQLEIEALSLLAQRATHNKTFLWGKSVVNDGKELTWHCNLCETVYDWYPYSEDVPNKIRIHGREHLKDIKIFM